MIKRAEYARRRRNLMAHLPADSIAIVAAASEQVRSRDTFFPFRQDSDFWYLTGFDQPDAVLVMMPGRSQGQCVMFCPERSSSAEVWDGPRLGPEEIVEQLQLDDAFPVEDIDDILPGLIEGHRRVYYSMGRSDGFDQALTGWMAGLRRQSQAAPGELTDLDHIVHDMRLIKSAAEQRLMRRAGEITARGHCRAMQACHAGQAEYALEAELQYSFSRDGARHMAYPAIVGGGKNACVLHYTANSDTLRDGDLVLIDAGCELGGYAADVTRTFPVNGRFSEPQRQLYDIVLAAQQAAIQSIVPGSHWNEAHEASERVITQGLLDIGVLEGDLEELMADQACHRYYMHKVGHWLGLDVHDVGDYRVGDAWRVLEAGMVLTVEPGIYIRPDDRQVARKWRGIGIRIEDNVLVTAHGCEVLTDGVPKTVAAIEALQAGQSE